MHYGMPMMSAMPSQTKTMAPHLLIGLPMYTSPHVSSYVTHLAVLFLPLSERLQNDCAIPKWSPRARMGVYLGASPCHARSVTLILSLSTGLCSLQFHVSHDDLFKTTRKEQNIDSSSKWQALSGLIKNTSSSPAPASITPSEGDLLLFTSTSEGDLPSTPPFSEGDHYKSPPLVPREEFPLQDDQDDTSPPLINLLCPHLSPASQ